MLNINLGSSRTLTLLVVMTFFVSAKVNSMQSLGNIFEDYMQNKFEPYAENEFRLNATLRCSSASFFMIGGGNPEVDGLGDYFRDLAFEYAFMLDEEKYKGDKTKEDIEEDNNFLIKKYYDEYVKDGLKWYKKYGLPNDQSKPSELFSDFFKNDMILCMDIYDAFEGSSN